MIKSICFAVLALAVNGLSPLGTNPANAQGADANARALAANDLCQRQVVMLGKVPRMETATLSPSKWRWSRSS